MGGVLQLLSLLSGTAAIGWLPGEAQDSRVIIEGVVDQGEPTVATTLGDAMQVDAGTVDALGRKLPRSGRLISWRRRGGAFVVWTFRATVVHAAPTARFEIRAGNAKTQGLRYAVGMRTRWERPDAGSTLPEGGSAILHASMQSGEHVVFQLALPIRTNEPAGIRTPSIRYALHPNGAALEPALLPRPLTPARLPRLPFAERPLPRGR